MWSHSVCGGHTKLCILLFYASHLLLASQICPHRPCGFNWQPRQIYDQQPAWPWCPAFCQFCCFLSLSCLSVLSCQVCPATACLQRDINKCCATQENKLSGCLRGKFFFWWTVNFWMFQWNECECHAESKRSVFCIAHEHRCWCL